MTLEELLERMHALLKHAQLGPCYYTLDENNVPVPTNSVMEWARWSETSNRRNVAADRIETFAGCWLISTVFVGINLVMSPILFETAVFGDSDNADGFWVKRTDTYAEALAEHAGIKAYITACGKPPGQETM